MSSAEFSGKYHFKVCEVSQWLGLTFLLCGPTVLTRVDVHLRTHQDSLLCCSLNLVLVKNNYTQKSAW